MPFGEKLGNASGLSFFSVRKLIFRTPYSSNRLWCQRTWTSEIVIPALMCEVKNRNNSLVTPILWNNRNGGWKLALNWHKMPWSWLRIWCLFRHRWSNWSNDPLTYHWLTQIVSWRQLWGFYTEDKPKITPIVVFVLMIQRSFSSWALAPTHFTICMRGWLILLFSFINEVGFSCQ